jgi:hypothetical protein
MGGLLRQTYPVMTSHPFRAPDMNMRPSSLFGIAAIAFSMGLGLGGCGDQHTTGAKATRSYQGKPDTAPWDDSLWHGDRANWERAITAREQNQNEYVRIPQ